MILVFPPRSVGCDSGMLVLHVSWRCCSILAGNTMATVFERLNKGVPSLPNFRIRDSVGAGASADRLQEQE